MTRRIELKTSRLVLHAQASATHPRTITAVAIGTVLHKAPILGAPGKVQDAIKQRASLARRLDEHQRLTFSRPNTPSTSIDDSAPLARTARRKACADAVSRHRPGGGIPSGGSLSNKGLLHCVHAFYRRKCTTYHPPTHAIVRKRQVANLPTVCMQREPIAERASRPPASLYVSPSCGVPRDGAKRARPCARTLKKGREGIIEPHRV